MRRPSPFVYLAVPLALFFAGCSTPTPARSPATEGATAADTPGGYLYRLKEMRAARRARERGARELERAYAALRAMDQEARFTAAMQAFGRATESYHAALVRAPDRYSTVIESEAETVAGYMRQIQRDRATR